MWDLAFLSFAKKKEYYSRDFRFIYVKLNQDTKIVDMIFSFERVSRLNPCLFQCLSSKGIDYFFKTISNHKFLIDWLGYCVLLQGWSDSSSPLVSAWAGWASVAKSCATSSTSSTRSSWPWCPWSCGQWLAFILSRWLNHCDIIGVWWNEIFYEQTQAPRDCWYVAWRF